VFNNVVLQEYIPLGQRVQEWTLEVRVDRVWTSLATGTTIGYKRIVRFDPIQADAVRLNVIRAKACPTLATIGVYLAE
jgi:alpha-L-fucosidase